MINNLTPLEISWIISKAEKQIHECLSALKDHDLDPELKRAIDNELIFCENLLSKLDVLTAKS